MKYNFIRFQIKMDTSRNKLNKLKSLFSEFLTVVDEINALHNAYNLRNRDNIDVDKNNLTDVNSENEFGTGSGGICNGDWNATMDSDSLQDGTNASFNSLSMVRSGSNLIPYPANTIDVLTDVNTENQFESEFETITNVNLSSLSMVPSHSNLITDENTEPEFGSYVIDEVRWNAPMDSDSLQDGTNTTLSSLSMVRSGSNLIPYQANMIDVLTDVNTENQFESEFETNGNGNVLAPMDSDSLQDLTNASFNSLSMVRSGSNLIPYPANTIDVLTNVNTENQFESEFETNGNGNVLMTELTTNARNTVMGVVLPDKSYFNESRLESIVNKETSQTNMTNYFYYLLPDGDDELDMLDVTESEVEPLNITETDVEVVNVVESEDEPSKVSGGSEFGSFDNTNELECVDSVNTVGSTLKISNVCVTVSNASVVAEKRIKRKRQSPPDCKTAQPFNIDIKPHNGCDNVNMFVPTSDVKVKLLCCAYCLERYPKLARHLESVHKNEVEVKEFRDLPKGSNERKAIISTIRKRGQFIWNTNAKLNGGELSTSRRPNKKFKKQAIHFNSCAKCTGSYSLTMLRKHWNKCTNNSMRGERIVKQLGHAVEGRVHPDACFDLSTIIFPSMRQNASVHLIRFDWLVVQFGNDLCLNYSLHFQLTFIRKKLREAGNLLLAAKSIDPEIADFASMYHVKHCNTIVDAIRKLARFDLKAKHVGAPATASALVTLVNAIGELFVIETMKRDETDQEKEKKRKAIEEMAIRFLTVFKKDARLKINKLVAVTQSKNKRRRHVDIPKTTDVNKLTTYLDRERDKCFMELSKSYIYDTWLELSKLTIVSIMVFNRKRPGEMQNIEKIDFEDREMITAESGLGTVPKKTMELIKSRMNIRGKLRRPVPVLLKHTFDECIDLLLLHRKDAGVSDKNDFLFALPTQSGYIRRVDAAEALKTFSKSCGADRPESLRGTKLRKHMASLCGTLNLSDNDVTNVANFMGHSDKIHRDVYRHNPLQREVVQMTALLETARGNDINTVTSNVIIESEESTSVVTKHKKKQTKIVAAKESKKQTGTSNVVIESKESTSGGTKRKTKQTEIVAAKKFKKQTPVQSKARGKKQVGG